ncbi:MAG: HD domain-containing protein [Candidatus Omnitrophica bacterium]|nr:HD domain-containing protein [Candidatus Omnitrophota bacterium]MCB9719486.1 HD domain-containing protein [Candidatus Omnitrophota bacterium]
MPSLGGQSIPFSEILTAVTYALDLTEGQPKGHCLRGCWIGFHIGRRLGLEDYQLWELYYTLLLKDAGCSSNAARLFQLYGSDDLKIKHDFKTVNTQKISEVVRFILEHAGVHESKGEQFRRIMHLAGKGNKLATELIQTRCESGALIAKQLGFSDDVADGVRFLDEHYNGKGRPEGLQGKSIPVYSRIALMAQVIDVFQMIGGKAAALREIQERRGSWFDPDIADAFREVSRDDRFWETLNGDDILESVIGLEPADNVMFLTEDRLDIMAEAFAKIIDSKSPFTYGHSSRVTEYAMAMAEKIGMDADRRRWFKRGALLHDIGKLGVSNAVLDKPGKLTDEEWGQIKLHPKYTEEILSKIGIFKELAVVAAAHHERLDGKGYHKGLKGEEIVLETRILTVADIYDALAAKRPYRDAMAVEKALGILDEMHAGGAIDGQCLSILKSVI